jgi:hypothetical protein
MKATPKLSQKKKEHFPYHTSTVFIEIAYTKYVLLLKVKQVKIYKGKLD